MLRYTLCLTLLLGFITPAVSADDIIRDPKNVCSWLGQANPSTGPSAYICKNAECSCNVTSMLGQKKIQWQATGDIKTIKQISWRMYLDTAQEKEYFGDISSGALSSWMKIASFAPIKQAIVSGTSTSWENEQYTVMYSFNSSYLGLIRIDLN